jgi:hypothetical protein
LNGQVSNLYSYVATCKLIDTGVQSITQFWRGFSSRSTDQDSYLGGALGDEILRIFELDLE